MKAILPGKALVDSLKTAQARALHKAMADAREALDEAYEKYQSALGVAIDDPDAGSEVAVRQEGRAYAAALSRYSEVTMAWLTYVDTHLRSKKAERAGG